MVTGWSCLSGSSGTVGSAISWTSALPREVTRMVILRWSVSSMPSILGFIVTLPFQLPARLLMASKDFSASEGGADWALDWASARVEQTSSARVNRERNFMVNLLLALNQSAREPASEAGWRPPRGWYLCFS